MTATTDTPTKPPSRQSQVLDWLTANPGFHQCRDIRAGLAETGIEHTTHQVATATRFLWDAGKIKRRALPTGKSRRPTNHYGIPA